MNKLKLPTREEIKSLLDYRPETGEFFWLANRGGRIKAGSRAGSLDTYRYVQIKFKGRLYFAHRIAWLLMHGREPDGDLDHINGNRSDNRIANLRPATRVQNCQNMALRSDSSSGLKGVSRHQKKYQARIRLNKNLIHLGYFETPEAAHEAYRKAAAEYFGEFARYA